MNNPSDDFIRKRFNDLDTRAYTGGYPVFTDFCDAAEINILHTMAGGLSCSIITDGGYDLSERQMACFMPSDVFLEDTVSFPMKTIYITPVSPKFSDVLTHRDFLGALMNLGIRRELMGDLLVEKSLNSCYVFCVDHIAEFITDNLARVKHTDVSVSIIDFSESGFMPDFRNETLIVTSDRLDSLVASAAHTSRSRGTALIDGEKVMINNRIEKSHTKAVSPGDIVTVRGKGKFRVKEFMGQTQKGRMKVSIDWYD